MYLVRYDDAGVVRIGVPRSGRIAPLSGVATLGELLALPLAEIRQLLDAPGGAPGVDLADVTVLAPIDGRTEVWAAGVTYQRSRQARMAESEHEASIYDRVYDAERPELFFKSVSWKVVGPGGTVSIRADSTIDVPEPELAVVVNAHGEIVGYTICDDVSSRSIEGENPLYLPQAKVWLGACALGPGIRPAWEIEDPYSLQIALRISRGGAVAWSGTAGTGGLKRRLDELVGYLFRADAFPAGAVLSTGTSLVPDLPFTLADGDSIAIEIDGIGSLETSVVRGRPA